jgi:DNA-binding response OmpR family regulator
MARVKAIFRRGESMKTDQQKIESEVIRAGAMAIDTAKRIVTLRDEAVDLTAKEFDLLLHFAQHPGRVYTRAQLLDLVWGYGHEGYEHTVNSHINRLRAKIEKNPAQPQYVLTVWGVGYKFADITKKDKEN